MTTFSTEHGSVVMVTSKGPVRLSAESVEGLLDIFQREGAAAQFNNLHDAAQKLDGFIPRMSCFRKEAA